MLKNPNKNQENNWSKIDEKQKQEKHLDELAGDSAYRGPIYEDHSIQEQVPLWQKYVKTFGIGVLIVIIHLIFRGKSSQDIHIKIIDSLFIAGVLLLGIGGISVINKQGFYDIGLYGLKKVLRLKNLIGDDGKVIDFYQYKKLQWKKRTARWEWVIVGSVFLGFSILILIISKMM